MKGEHGHVQFEISFIYIKVNMKKIHMHLINTQIFMKTFIKISVNKSVEYVHLQ